MLLTTVWLQHGGYSRRVLKVINFLTLSIHQGQPCTYRAAHLTTKGILMKKIIVHGRTAHFDEVAAAALIMGHYGRPIAISRRCPLDQELDDPEVAVVDCGAVYDPAHSNFDHHHDDQLEAAFVLVAKHLGYWATLTKMSSAWQYYSDKDIKGPLAAAKVRDIPQFAIEHMISPIEGGLIHIFQQQTEHPIDSPIVQLLFAIGTHWKASANAFASRYADLALYARRVVIKGVPILVHEIRENPELAINVFRKETAQFRDTALSLSPDMYSDGGWSIYRFGEDPRVSCSLLKGKPMVTFVHNGGFLAKLQAMPLEQALAMASETIITN